VFTYDSVLPMQPGVDNLTGATVAMLSSSPVTAGPATGPINVENVIPVMDNAARVKRMYRQFLHRNGDPTGINFYAGQLTSGYTVQQVAQEFISSAEFQTYQPASLPNDKWVAMLYQFLFNRQGDPGGLSYWVGQLNSNAQTRQQVLDAFMSSAEFTAQY
jgi:hypothetical protein